MVIKRTKSSNFHCNPSRSLQRFHLKMSLHGGVKVERSPKSLGLASLVDSEGLYKMFSVWTKTTGKLNSPTVDSHLLQGVCLESLSGEADTYYTHQSSSMAELHYHRVAFDRVSDFSGWLCCCSQVFIEPYNVFTMDEGFYAWALQILCVCACVFVLPPGLRICRTGFCGGGSALGGPNSSSNVS